ncbi:MAG TPA: DNA methylase, partial [Saccharofermentans sp.]|nr:DNA methylase [Saccharofermentans sp.]
LMPCSDNPKADMDIFLKIMAMDNDGLIDRKQKKLSVKELYELARRSRHFRQYLNDWFEVDGAKVKIRNGPDKYDIEMRLFKTLGYDDKLKYCVRPEQLATLRKDSWNAINHHLGTNAKSLNELVEQLSMQRYGRLITVGDCFSGGGSIPFDAARIGANAYGSDLNPVAALLTWADMNVIGAREDDLLEIRKFQNEVFDFVDKEITELGIEPNENGERAISYLYCIEANCPECGTKVPLAPSWIIGKRTNTVAILHKKGNGYDIEVKMDATQKELKNASAGTVTSKGLLCPRCGKTIPIQILRGDRTDANGNTVYGLRQWEKTEFDFREDDIYNERLYAIKYESKDGQRYYRAPNERDLADEAKVKRIVSDSISSWQEQGLVPSGAIESGFNTDQIVRERGWTHWNHLFNARQLLVISKFVEATMNSDKQIAKVVGTLGINKCVDWNSRLCRWDAAPGSEKIAQTFSNQALNTMFNYPARGVISFNSVWFYTINSYKINRASVIDLMDARNVNHSCDFWVTDPPYADAINYHELSEFFLAWDKRLLQEAFPEWYTDSKRVLAVRGDEHFSKTMIDIYSNLTNHMPDDGMQVVMFTHSDPAVWAQLALIMWKSGLRVTAAWNIATETDASGLKDGNYVKGTVLLVLRKQTGDTMAFLDEINSDIRAEVRRQIASMLELENKEEPNFSDP